MNAIKPQNVIYPPLILGKLEPIERSLIARFADRLGYIPAIGTLSGLARVTCSVATGIFSSMIGLLTYLCGFTNLAKKCDYLTNRSIDEFVRGWIEVIPCLAKYLDKVREGKEDQGEISDRWGAYGRFLYKTPAEMGFICYSQKAHEGSVSWTERFEGKDKSGGVIGASGVILSKPIQAFEALVS